MASVKNTKNFLIQSLIQNHSIQNWFYKSVTIVFILQQACQFSSGQVLQSTEMDTNPESQEIVLNDTPTSESYTVAILNNLTRCSVTELSLKKESLLYTWDIKGFLGYYSFMQKFDQPFEMKTEQISFKSDIVDGKWFFKVSKVMNGPSYQSSSDLLITSTYSYEAKQPKNLNFYIQLSLIHNDKEVVLPVQKSSNPMVTQQRLYNRRGYSSYLEHVHTFLWPGSGQAVENMIIKKPLNQGDKDLSASEEAQSMGEQEPFPGDNYTENNEDVTLRFRISAYYPSEPVYSGFENCPISPSHHQTSQDQRGDVKTPTLLPPYVKHSYSMLHDDRFADVKLKARDQILMAHKIILATSSPVFSGLFDNDTMEQSSAASILADATIEAPRAVQFNPTENLIDLDMDPEVAMEMLRYIYTGRVSLDKVANKLIKVAVAYELHDLKRLCEKFLLNKINTENAIEMYKIGHEVGSSKLTKMAFAVIKANKSKIVLESEDFKRLTAAHPELMFELFVA